MSADPTRASMPPIELVVRRPRRTPLRVPIDDVPRGSLADGLTPAAAADDQEYEVDDALEIEVQVSQSMPAPRISMPPPFVPGSQPPPANRSSFPAPASADPAAVAAALPQIPKAPAVPSMEPFGAVEPSEGPEQASAEPSGPDSVEIALGADAEEPAIEQEVAGAAEEDAEVEEMDATDFVEEARAESAQAAAEQPAAARPPGPPVAPPVAPPAAPPAAPAAARPPAPPPAPPAVPVASKKFRNWFENFFNEDYLRTVKVPNARAVARECDFIEKALGLAPGAQILDVGCGLGLQANELTRRGYIVVGIDLSKTMVTRANEDAKDYGFEPRFLIGDMREMTFDISFDAVLCWGTSFGYFEDDVNRLVLQRMRDALREGGRLLLDVANRDFVVRSQPNLVWFEGDGCVCMEETQFNAWASTLEVSRNVMLDEGRQREAQYAVRLYTLHELSKELTELGFRVNQTSGSISTPGVFFGADAPRIVITAERRAAVSKPPMGPQSIIPPI